jgi:hypothetical protein
VSVGRTTGLPARMASTISGIRAPRLHDPLDAGEI